MPARLSGSRALRTDKSNSTAEPDQAQSRTRCAISRHRQQRPRPEQLRKPRSPADLGIPLPCCSAPLPSTLRTGRLSLMKARTRLLTVEAGTCLCCCRAARRPPSHWVGVGCAGCRPALSQAAAQVAEGLNARCPRAGVPAPHGLASLRSRHARARAPHGCLPPFSRRSHVCCANSRATSLRRGAAKLSLYLLLPQLLRLSTESPPVLVDPPASSDTPFSYKADAYRHCTISDVLLSLHK
jgi:hypothetical protein